ncbi:MAG: mobile mystery protein A [Sphingobacteriia bacterium]|jgi:predicted DNA-binding mobile mystery protein A|nr:mobile mystery protein A [Sphingobacteriia bacterium]NDC73148.1 mobile mystery protein A [Sphingobacteriia bacterium]
MAKKSLQVQQLNTKMLSFAILQEVTIPPTGWIRAIRTAIGMSMRQLGKKLNVTKQGIMDIENRERDGSITLKSLREIARVMDMQLVYGLVPNDGSLDALIDKKAVEVAKQVVMRSAQTMTLEDQANSTIRIETAIRERAEAIKSEMPKILWD